MAAENVSGVQDRPRGLFSRFYASMSPRLDEEGLAELREELLAPLAGAVVEVGAGPGGNFARYPSGVVSVIAVEPEPYLRGLAGAAAGDASVPTTVHAGVAEALPLPDSCADGVVFCLVLCSVPDQIAAATEAARVLRPGGIVRFLEHTRAEMRGLRTVQRVADATVWPLLTGGCHTCTDPVAALREAGFVVDDVRRLRFPADRFTQPSTPHVLGTARLPG
ncbi:class I SAM-dependent methyltransferase [Pseudonocardia parietis]|uniref:SAM-dependent methyltransferase n=1 Tax=Pseudonocardia parietis TaxID=570936 RepID=A0ABS4W739_9PSEU|nr:class I SAM-dependent methyltransferase [Pseudonocardia parietis]MBP2372019.1 SAM-dependent methyltransferase [Pseudonocardia parietis]